MDIKKFVSGFIRTNCYLLTEKETAILVDAEVELKTLQQETKKLDAILLTHGHFDHIKNLNKIAQYYSCPIYLHEKAVEKLTDSIKNCSEQFGAKRVVGSVENLDLKPLKGGEKLNIGNVHNIEVFHTPGHTACSVSFKIGKDLFSGDTLFVGAIGRTDLWDSSAKDMKKSLQKLNDLDYENIYPGHGFSGKNI